jgi:lysozyme
MFDGIIDINHNDNVDLAKAKAEGVVAVIHKATEGKTFKDPKYAAQRAKADALGLLWGAYHFATNALVSQQLDNFAHVAAPLRPHDFVALDYETNHPEGGSDITMSLAQAEDFVQQFKARFGFTPAIYGSDLLTAAAAQHPTSALKDCKLWIAQYKIEPQPSLPSLWTKFTLWQFTDGVNGDQPHKTAGVACDRNRFNGTVDDLRIAWPLR